MSYLLDKKTKRRQLFYVLLFVAALLIVFYFRSGIWRSLTFFGQTVFRPVLVGGNNIGARLQGFSAYFFSKNSLYRDNERLRSQLDNNETRMANYDSILAENETLKEILNRKSEAVPMTLAGILLKPNQSLYDTLVIDAGSSKGISEGDMVFAFGNIPIGRVSEIHSDSSKVVLFSASGERSQVVVGTNNIFLEAVGRGGGNFEVIMPRDVTILKGEEVILPGITPYVLGIVETIISDPRDPFTKALLKSPVNIQELKFVQIDARR